MGASNSSSVVVVAKPTAPTVSGFHVKISFDGEDIANNEGDYLIILLLAERKAFP